MDYVLMKGRNDNWQRMETYGKNSMNTKKDSNLISLDSLDSDLEIEEQPFSKYSLKRLKTNICDISLDELPYLNKTLNSIDL